VNAQTATAHSAKQAATEKPKPTPAAEAALKHTPSGRGLSGSKANGKNHAGPNATEQLKKATSGNGKRAAPAPAPVKRPTGLFIELWKDTKSSEWLFFIWKDSAMLATSPRIYPVNGKLTCEAQAKVTAKALGIKTIILGTVAAK
jgi:hypothetical protein